MHIAHAILKILNREENYNYALLPIFFRVHLLRRFICAQLFRYLIGILCSFIECVENITSYLSEYFQYAESAHLYYNIQDNLTLRIKKKYEAWRV